MSSALLPPSGAASVSLSACDREAIHNPQAIQPHGILLTYDEKSATILRVSQNFSELFEGSAEGTLSQPVWGVLGHEWRSRIESVLSGSPCLSPSYVSCPLNTSEGWHALVHRVGPEVILEWLHLPTLSPTHSAQLQQRTLQALRRFAVAPSLTTLCEIAVEEIRAMTGFDRVMIYAFDEYYNGEVLAESRVAKAESFLGLRFPASDIPKSARELYLRNLSRLLCDVEYKEVSILCSPSKQAMSALDQSQSALRSIAPVHREYLRNMKVRSSMSLSLIQKGRLWGLISCANCEDAAQLPYPVWLSLETIAEAFSARLSERVNTENLLRRQQASAQIAKISTRIASATHLNKVLWDERAALMTLAQAEGAALSHLDDLVLMGQTPPASMVRELIEWLGEQPSMINEGYFAEHSCTITRGSRRQSMAPFYGVMAIALSSQSPRQCLLWFRKEVVTTTRWGGNPNKPTGATDPSLRIHPRKSFEMYKEVVRGQAEPWAGLQIDIAKELKSVIMDHLVNRTERLEKLNAELRRSNLELDSFAYAASHDLKEPVRGIHHYANFLQREQKDTLGVLGNQRLDTITRLTKRMDDLLNSLLEYAKIGRAELSFREHDFSTLCASTVEMLGPWLDGKGVVILLPKDSTPVVCDSVRVMEVLSNLIANAAKYNDKTTERWVKVGCKETSHGQEFFVQDNGIGISEANLLLPFQLFKRLHTKDAFGGGSGTGLALAKAIVERHGGRIWLESCLNEGTTVHFTLRHV